MSRMITQSLKTVHGVDLKTPRLIEPPPRVTVGPPPEKIIVVCVWWGTLYPVKYVENLRNGVNRHLSIPHEIVCITERNDVPDGVRKIPTPLSSANKGWWQKPSMFKPGLFKSTDRLLYMDLDVVVVGSLDKIASVQEPFCMIENFGPNKRHAAHNSSVMVWTPTPETERIYTCFSPDVMRELHGDQCFTWRVMRDDIHDYPKSWVVSYKYERYRKEWQYADKDTAIVVFHGKPKPHEVKDKQIVNNWK